MRNRNSLSYPGNDIKIFVKWYKAIMSKVEKKQHEKIIKVKYENFFENFKTESHKLCRLLGINRWMNSPGIVPRCAIHVFHTSAGLINSRASLLMTGKWWEQGKRPSRKQAH